MMIDGTTPIPKANFEHVKVGDKVTRLLGGSLRMPMQVVEVTADLIVCAAIQDGGLFNGGWTFNRVTGIEEDHEIGWGTPFGATGSYLVLEN